VGKTKSASNQLEFTWDGAPQPPVPPPCVEKIDTPVPRATPHVEAAFRSRLEKLAGIPILVSVTDNASSLLSAKRDSGTGTVRLRMHHMFLAAGPQVVRALADWIKSPRAKKSGILLNGFIRENWGQVRRPTPRQVTVVTKGTCFNLREIFDDVNRLYFDNAITATILWGQMPDTDRRRRSIRFGGYFSRANLIRIHPLLDQPFVPAYFVRYIVFHEMLHASLDNRVPAASGRRRLHTAEFKRREQACADYARAMAWENDPRNLKRLLAKSR
jgi:hypothetical protein